MGRMKTMASLARPGQPRTAVPTWFLEPRTFLLNQSLDLLHEGFGRHIFGLLFSTSADVHLPGLCFFISHHKQEWHLLHGVFADLGIHLFIAGIDVYAHTNRFELVSNFVRIVRVAL